MNDNQTTIFDMMYPKYKITKPIRLIEFFAGYGSQALALKYLGVPFEHWKICEWAVKSIQAYKDIHFSNDNTDYSKNQDKEMLIDILYSYGISANYNEPMTLEQIKRLNEKNLRTIYNNIIATNNLVNIATTTGDSLEIVDTDKYDYILTYSFPCQDLSLAGKGKGMSDTSTRSGMLWGVERILSECKELNSLPQILLMENVPQVHGADNVQDFNKWQLRLEELGYHNYFQDLIATDYGIPQTRNRCFMISILGDYSYTFPKSIPLKLKLKDMLEDNVDEKYYLSDKKLNYILDMNDVALSSGRDINNRVVNPNIAKTISCRGAADQRADVTNFVINNENKEIKVKEVKLLIKNNTKKGYLEAHNGDGIDLTQLNSKTRRGRVQKDSIQTLTTQNNLGVCVIGGIGEKKSNGGTQWYQQDRIYDNNIGLSLSTTAQPYYPDNQLRIRKLTPKECWRLMGFDDEDFEKASKVNSNAQLYKQAGNSIVVNVLMAIFNELLKKEGE